jgi:hypothetical protein
LETNLSFTVKRSSLKAKPSKLFNGKQSFWLLRIIAKIEVSFKYKKTLTENKIVD